MWDLWRLDGSLISDSLQAMRRCIVILAILASPACQPAEEECGGGRASKHGSAPPVVTAPAPVEVVEFPLAMGSTDQQVGTISVWSDSSTLYVRYALATGFTLTEAHLCVATQPFEWQAPGSCPYIASGLAAGTTEHTFEVPLAELDATCGTTLTLQAHGTIPGERGLGGSAYAGTFRGQVAYALTCRTPDDGPPPPSCRLDSPHTQGYWKNHANKWPVYSLTIGGVVYDQPELLALFRTPPTGDASLILDHQLVAAMLNVHAGVATPFAAASALEAADRWVAANADADGRLPFGVASGAATYGEGISLAETLDRYNNGELE